MKYAPGIKYLRIISIDEFCRLRISPACTNLIWELKRYRWKTYQTKKLEYENNPYDEPHKKDDHACDALRYIIMQRPDLLKKDDGEAVRQEVDEAMDELTGKLRRYNTNMADCDDPHNRMESSPAVGTFNPEQHIPSPASDDWEYDEHMGGYW